MNTLSPSREGTTRKMSRLLLQSRSQPRLGLIRNKSEEGKHVPLSASFQSSVTALPTPRTFRKPSPAKKIYNKITDFYDKKQISNAISSAKNLNDRVKLIDSIVKHRDEIQEIEKQTRFERIAPVLLKMGQNLRKKVMAKAVENSVRRSFFPETVLIASPADSLSSFITDTEIMSDTSRKGSVFDKRESIFSDVQPYSSQQTARENESLPPIMLTAADSFKMEPLFEGGSNKQSNFAPKKGSEKKKQSLILALLSKKTTKPGASPRGLVFRSEENQEDFTTRLLNSTKNHSRRAKDGSIPRDVYGLGSKVLEMDLYKFLVKNQNKEGARKVVTDNREVKEPMMRDIESKAKSKFEEFVHHKKQANFLLPNSYLVEQKRAEKARNQEGSSKYISYGLNSEEFDPIKEKPSKPKYVKSSSFIRNAEQEVFNDPYGFIYNANEKEFTGNDESFASLTETKLDDLYRKTYKINKKLAIATDNLNRSTKKSDIKKWEEYKQKQSKNLLEHSTEALRTIKRKINQKAFC